MPYLALDLVRWHRLITVTVGIGCNVMHTFDPEREEDRRHGEPGTVYASPVGGNVERGVPGDKFAGCQRIA